MNIFQQSIARTRATLHEYNRLRGIVAKRIKADHEKANANLELLIDEIVAETGIELTPQTFPIIAFYVARFVDHQRQRKEESFEGDYGGMKDFGF
jgi:hypothetical protein